MEKKLSEEQKETQQYMHEEHQRGERGEEEGEEKKKEEVKKKRKKFLPLKVVKRIHEEGKTLRIPEKGGALRKTFVRQQQPKFKKIKVRK